MYIFIFLFVLDIHSGIENREKNNPKLNNSSGVSILTKLIGKFTELAFDRKGPQSKLKDSPEITENEYYIDHSILYNDNIKFFVKSLLDFSNLSYIIITNTDSVCLYGLNNLKNQNLCYFICKLYKNIYFINKTTSTDKIIGMPLLILGQADLNLEKIDAIKIIEYEGADNYFLKNTYEKLENAKDIVQTEKKESNYGVSLFNFDADSEEFLGAKSMDSFIRSLESNLEFQAKQNAIEKRFKLRKKLNEWLERQK